MSGVVVRLKAKLLSPLYELRYRLKYRSRSGLEVVRKMEEFRYKLNSTGKDKYKYYIEALEWVIRGNNP